MIKSFLKTAFWLAVIFVAYVVILVTTGIHDAKAGDLWITTGMWSQHPNQDHYHYNQTNYGIGIAYEVNHNLTYVAGEYENSLYQNSKYFGITNEPYRIGGAHIGYLAGFVSGYTKTPKFQPMVAPMASYEYKGVGINLIWVPSVVTAIQLKLKVW